MTATFWHVLRAERIKVKRTSVLYLTFIGGLLVTILAAVGHTIDVHALSGLGQNPWDQYTVTALASFSVFMLVPFATLLTATLMVVEQRAQAWKYLYTLPTPRGRLYIAKMLVLVGLLIATIALCGSSLVASAYAIELRYPEFEFSYHAPGLWDLLERLTHSLLAVLGTIGLLYAVSVRFRHAVLTVGVGLFGFIAGLVVVFAGRTDIALYVPFAQPMLAQDFGMFSTAHTVPVLGGWLTNVEAISVSYFVVCLALGYSYETRRNVT